MELQNRQRPVPGFSSLVSGSVRIDRELTDGELIIPDATRDVNLRVFHTPGHSPGSISLFMQNEGILFSGDVIPVPGDLPVYDDALASVQSIQRLRQINGIHLLLAAWDIPREGNEAYGQMDRAIQYIQEIHEAVRAAGDTGLTDLMDLTRETAAALDLPLPAVTPLLARTFAANLKVQDRKNLLNDSL